MATETGRTTRTIKGYVVDLLEYPRWVIEREVDFTNCRAGGHHNEFLEECVECRFGEACRWLDRNRTPAATDGRLDELLQALESAVAYLGAPERMAAKPPQDTRSWLREAQRFLRSHRG